MKTHHTHEAVSRYLRLQKDKREIRIIKLVRNVVISVTMSPAVYSLMVKIF